MAVYRLETRDGLTQFTYLGTSDEKDHLREKNSVTEAEDMQEFLDLQAKGMTLKEIAAETGIPKSTIHRKLKKALEMGMVPNVKAASAPADDVSHPTGNAGNVEQDGTATRLPFKDDED